MPERIEVNSTWLDPATHEQVRAIARLCRALGIREHLEENVTNRREARDTIYQLRNKLSGGVYRGSMRPMRKPN